MTRTANRILFYPYHLFLLLSVVFLSRCIKADEHDLSFRITGLAVYPTSTAEGRPKITGLSVSRNLFGIRLDLFPQEVKAGDFNSDESYVYTDNPVTAIKIWSDQPYNSIPAYGSLNTQFLHFKGNYFAVDSIPDGGAIYPSAKNYPDYKENHYPSYTHLISRSAPQPGAYKFYVSLTLEDGTYFVDSTPVIQLTP